MIDPIISLEFGLQQLLPSTPEVFEHVKKYFRVRRADNAVRNTLTRFLDRNIL
jgi:hypothetical protein